MAKAFIGYAYGRPAPRCKERCLWKGVLMAEDGFEARDRILDHLQNHDTYMANKSYRLNVVEIGESIYTMHC